MVRVDIEFRKLTRAYGVYLKKDEKSGLIHPRILGFYVESYTYEKEKVPEILFCHRGYSESFPDPTRTRGDKYSFDLIPEGPKTHSVVVEEFDHSKEGSIHVWTDYLTEVHPGYLDVKVQHHCFMEKSFRLFFDKQKARNYAASEMERLEDEHYMKYCHYKRMKDELFH